MPDDKVIRIPGVPCNPGYVGCSQAHCNALRHAIDRNWRRFVVFEDDFAWRTTASDIDKHLNHFLQKFDDRWDVVMLGGNYGDTEPAAAGIHKAS